MEVTITRGMRINVNYEENNKAEQNKIYNINSKMCLGVMKKKKEMIGNEIHWTYSRRKVKT